MPEDRRRAPLSSELAQRVVDLIAPTISHNINVMDEHGTIIACLDPSRVGSLHRGAQRVISERRRVLVTTPEPDTSDRPGANEPLFIDGELRGVVGVTGSPREVEPLARVVALTVQLLIAQELEQDAVSRRHTEARDLIASLSSGTTRGPRTSPRSRCCWPPMPVGPSTVRPTRSTEAGRRPEPTPADPSDGRRPGGTCADSVGP